MADIVGTHQSPLQMSAACISRLAAAWAGNLVAYTVQEVDSNDAEYIYPRFAARSFGDEFGSTIDGDVLLLQVWLPDMLL